MRRIRLPPLRLRTPSSGLSSPRTVLLGFGPLGAWSEYRVGPLAGAKRGLLRSQGGQERPEDPFPRALLWWEASFRDFGSRVMPHKASTTRGQIPELTHGRVSSRTESRLRRRLSGIPVRMRGRTTGPRRPTIFQGPKRGPREFQMPFSRSLTSSLCHPHLLCLLEAGPREPERDGISSKEQWVFLRERLRNLSPPRWFPADHASRR